MPRKGWKLLEGAPQVSMQTARPERAKPNDFSNKLKCKAKASPWSPPENRGQDPARAEAVSTIPAAGQAEDEVAQLLAKEEMTVKDKLKTLAASEEKTPEALRKVSRSLEFLDKLKTSGGLVQ